METALVGLAITLLVGGAAGMLWWMRWRARIPR
jgi:hypothetical protein